MATLEQLRASLLGAGANNQVRSGKVCFCEGRQAYFYT